MTPPKSVALAVTSYYGPFYEDGKKTGAYFSEVYHPWKYFTEQGYKVQLFSETGTFNWDQHSIADGALSADEKAVLDDKSHDFHKATQAIKKASELNPADYGVFYAAGGHGTIFDFDGKAPGVASFAGKVWDDGGVVSAVCHGPVILGFIKDKDGKLVTEGRKVTGFSDEGEVLFHLDGLLKKNGWKTVQDVVKGKSTYVAPEPPLASTVVTDGRLLTGANPASATPLAEAVDKVYKSL
ncbi:Glyoxalase 3 [Wickerhamiella sorbophila]|uniref:D-lactate dehydratase n=1 Tax=Wickerhamiella sorbophila TaxID=45607 RepID=A0A2T0FGA2_9ASCO|nr:Glyoxalase 3 [Wickerhamiella sorbophila]PRT54010.1 Glyoxalase 3 [Wickerhamiella sorbophila]